MHSQKLALGIVAFVGKSRINSVGKFAFVLLLSLTLPMLVVAESREVALAKLNQVIAQTQTREERRQEALRLNQLGVEYFDKGKYREALERFQQALAIHKEISDKPGESSTLDNIGSVYLRLEQHYKALESYQKSLIISKQIHDKLGERTTLSNIGSVYSSLNQYPKALEFYQQALIISEQIPDKTGKGAILNNIGSVYEKLEKYPKALEFYQQALAVSKQIGDQFREGKTLYDIGSVYFKLKQYAKALEFYQQALVINKQLGDKSREGKTLYDIGSIYFKLEDYTKALEFYQQALVVNKQLGNQSDEGYTLFDIGSAYSKLEDYTKALEFYQQALAINKRIGNHAEEGYTLHTIGLIYYTLKQYSQALEFYKQALTVYKQIDNKVMEASVLNNIGRVYLNWEQYSKALKFYQQALVIYQQIDDKLNQSTNLNDIGFVYDSLGQYSEALKAYNNALAIATQVGDKARQRTALNNIGGIYHSLGQYSNALDFYEKSLAIATQLGDKSGEGTALNNIGGAYQSLKQYSKALVFYKKSLVIAKQLGNKSGEGYYSNNVGEVYSNLGEYSKALEFYQKALEISKQTGNKSREGITLHNIAVCYSDLGEYLKALEFYQQALVIHEQTSNKVAKGTTLDNIGYIFLLTGKLAKSIEILQAAIDIQESLRAGLKDPDKVSIIDRQRNSYRYLQQAYISQKQHEEALEISERGRARAFVELLAEKQQTQVQPKPTINQLKQIAKEQNATLVEYSIIDEEFKIEGKKQWLESQLYIWVVKPTGEVEFKSVDLRKQNTTIASLIPRFRKSINIASRNAGELIFKPGDRVRFKDDPSSAQPWEVISFDAKKQEIAVTHPTFAPGSTPTIRSIKEVDDSKQAPLQELHKLLIEPIAEFLPAKATDKIIFIPQAELFSVPFAALQDKKGKFLIEKHTILTSPSIQVLDLTRKQRQKLPSNVKEALVVGNPNPMPQPFGALKYATSEAQSIAKLYNTQAIIDNAATESAIVAKMPNARVIHLATHGDFNDTKGLESKIVLAPDAKNDGFLTAGEIFDLFGQPNSKTSLHAELVVLSACDTGRGEISGDGVIGLSRSLISAGVPSVVVSLWAVDDGATKFLMEEFYQQLKNNDKATALRNAMLATKEKNPNPQYWAAFTLIGEAN